MKSPTAYDTDGLVVEAMLVKDCSVSALFNSFYIKERQEIAKAKCAQWSTDRTVEQDFLLFCQRIVHEHATLGLR